MRQVENIFTDTVVPITVATVKFEGPAAIQKEVLLTAHECKNCHRVFAVEEDYLDDEAGICACPCCGTGQIINEPEYEEATTLLLGE